MTNQNIKNQVMKQETKDIRTVIQESIPELAKALPIHMSAERLCRIALTTFNQNPKLYQCTPRSILAALFQCAQVGLEPGLEGQAYIIPYTNKGVLEAQFQIGYRGIIELFYRHQNSLSLDVQEVRENDKFEYEYGTDAYITHKPALKDRGEIIGYYAIAKMDNGASIFKFMTKDECINHGIKYSKCFDKNNNSFYSYTPWATNPEAMCKKTVIKQLMKLVPKSIEIQKALSMDETIKDEVKPDMIEVPDKMEWIDETKEISDGKDN